MRPPTPPKEMQRTEPVDDDVMEVERTETVEVVLFDYEDEENSFSISFEFEYTYTQKIDKDVILA